ncbi:MAG: DUF4349 domain-containing protein [Dehalococcoidia bacterium]|nr:DUF4349 domain-containing protein [Dehalococcoidia bacterium]
MTKRFKFLIPLLLVLTLTLTGACASAMPSPSMPEPSEKWAGDATEKYVEEQGYPGREIPVDLNVERKIVKSGRISLEVESVVTTMGEIASIADELGGYVVSSDKYETDEGPSANMNIRIPVEKFDQAFDRLRQLAIDVPHESTDSMDVTEEYVDLQARLHNLQATESQYLALLEKAESVEDTIQVWRELSNIREQIEQIEGRMKYLERTSDMSFIHISLSEPGALAGPWSPSNAIRSAIRGLVTFLRGIVTALIWIGIFCWIWIPALVFYLRRRRKSRM